MVDRVQRRKPDENSRVLVLLFARFFGFEQEQISLLFVCLPLKSPASPGAPWWVCLLGGRLVLPVMPRQLPLLST